MAGHFAAFPINLSPHASSIIDMMMQNLPDLIGPDRLTEKITLCSIAPKIAQHIKLLGSLDPFGNDSMRQLVAQINHGCNELLSFISHLAEFCYRLNRRFKLEDMIPRLGYAAVRTPPMPQRLLSMAEAWRVSG
jgi:hypothetical protein